LILGMIWTPYACDIANNELTAARTICYCAPIAFTKQLLVTGLKIRSSSHILRTLSSAILFDFAVTVTFRFLVVLIDLILVYPPLTTKSRSIVSPSGSLTYRLFSIVTKIRKSDTLVFFMGIYGP